MLVTQILFHASDSVAYVEGLAVGETCKLFVLRLLIQVSEKSVFSFYIAEPLVPEPSALEVELAIEKL